MAKRVRNEGAVDVVLVARRKLQNDTILANYYSMKNAIRLHVFEDIGSLGDIIVFVGEVECTEVGSELNVDGEAFDFEWAIGGKFLPATPSDKAGY